MDRLAVLCRSNSKDPKAQRYSCRNIVLASLQKGDGTVLSKKHQNDKELLCIFLGLEFYTSPERARILKAKVADLLLANLHEDDLLGIKMKAAVDLTPTFSKLKRKLSKS